MYLYIYERFISQTYIGTDFSHRTSENENNERVNIFSKRSGQT